MELLGHFWQVHWVFAIAVLCLIAFFAGFVDSVAGGGGLFLVPGFLLVGLPPQVALGQEKVVSTLGTLAAIRNFFLNSKILWKIVLVGIPFSLAGAYTGAHSVLQIDQRVLEKILLILIPIAIGIFLIPRTSSADSKDMTKRTLIIAVPIVCFCIGFYDGFFGPGTGSILILCFHLALKLDLVSASANAKAFNFASNIGALIAFVMAGKVVYVIALPLVISNIIGNHLGSKMAITRGSRIVRQVLVFAMVSLFASVGLRYFI